jgi:hypothetical protein
MTTWSIDAEFGWAGGDRCASAFVPVILCILNTDTGGRRSFWGRDPALAAFVRAHGEDLFVSHNLIAEAAYLLRVGVEPPALWWDSMLAFRYTTNAETVVGFSLENALACHGIPHRFAGEKDQLQKWIGNLQFDNASPDDRRRIQDYCLADCESTAALYHALVGAVPETWMRHAAAFALATARMELRGVAVDTARYAALLERKDEVVRRVTARVNATCPVFVNGQLSRPRFFAWCAANGVGWPSRRSPRTGRELLSLDRRTFERMKDRHPFIREIHEANKTCKQLNSRTLAVDFVRRRHYFGNIPFGAATGRTAFRGFILSAPRWMRWLVVPSSPEHTLLSVDFDAEEICIAAALSGDGTMMAGYAGGDPHMAFAVRAGAAPEGATKHTHPIERTLYKVVNLAVNYGQTAYGLAQQTGMHPQQAQTLLNQHRRAYPDFYAWVDRWLCGAFRLGVAYTVGGWPRKVSRQDNPRSVGNFAVQGGAGDLMRLATVNLIRQGCPLIAVNHDSFLFDVRRDRLSRLREAVDSALRCAVERLLPGAPMRWTAEVFSDRYRDEGGKALWQLVDGLLTSRRLRKVVSGVQG